MNEITDQNSLISKIQIFFKSNYKIISFLFLIFLIFFFLLQFFFYYKNNQILDISIKYNQLKSNTSSNLSNNDFKESLKQFSNNKNFYNILSKLEIIKINLEDNDIIKAKDNYFELLKNSKLSHIYKSAIATNAAYNLIDKINKNNHIEIINYINDLLFYIDVNLESYYGYKIEIQYLISYIEYDNNSTSSMFEKVEQLFELVQENEQISADIKERVKKIHEFQKYK